MKRSVLNTPVLVLSLVAFGICGVGIVGLHRWQLSRIATGLLSHSQASEVDSQWHKSAEFLDRYLRIKPTDSAVRGRLALTYAKGAQSLDEKQQAVSLCYRALGAGYEPDEQKLRSQLADLLNEVGRNLEAEHEAQKLLSLDPANPQAQRSLALAIYAQFMAGSLSSEQLENSKIITQVDRACETNPNDVELAEIAAALYREHAAVVHLEFPALADEERFKRADEHLDKVILANPKNAAAFLARYRYRARNSLVGKELDLQQALELQPKDPNVLLTAAAATFRQGLESENTEKQQDALKHFEAAKGFYETLIADNLLPRNSEPYLGLGDACSKMGDIDGAVKAWREGLRIFIQPSMQAVFHGRIADSLIRANRDSEVAESLEAIDGILAKVGSGSISQGALNSLLRAQDLRHALLAMKRAQFQAAIPFLQRVVSRLSPDGDSRGIEFYAWNQLGLAFGSLGEWSEAGVAFDRAAKVQPQSMPVRLAAAHAWLSAGRPDLATDRAEIVLATQNSYDAWLILAASQFQLQVSMAITERSWNRLEDAFRALQDVPADAATPWRVDLLQAEYLAFRGRSEGDTEQGRQKARVVLGNAYAEHSKDASFLIQLSAVYEKLDFSTEADKVIRQMQDQKMSELEIALAQARLYVRRKDYPRAKDVLIAAAKTTGALDQTKLRQELLRVADAAGEMPLVEQLLEAQLSESAGNLRLLQQRCELAIERRDFKALSRWRTKLSAAGPIGSLWSRYYEAMQLCLTATSASDSQLKSALTAQESLVAARPNWPQAFVLRGMIEERMESWKAAAASYESAVQLGAAQPGVFERLIAVLERLHRSAEAEKYLSRLESVLPFSQRLTEFASGQEFRRDPIQAIEIARKATVQRPDDPQARIWLARLLLLNGQLPEAEQEFQRAIEISNDVRAWSGLFSFYLRTGNTEKARATLTEMAAKAEIDPADRDFVVAQGLESLGDWERAQASYEAAAKQTPKNALIQVRLAGLHLRSDPEQAISCLRKAVEWDPQLAAARRMLAAILAARGSDADIKEAEDLLSQVSGPQSSISVEDRRLRALLLAQHGKNEDVTRATRLMEEIVSRGTGSLPGDHLVLAQLYESQSRKALSIEDSTAKIKAARQQFLTVAARETAEPSHLIALIEFLMRHDGLADATSWIEKLESKVPGTEKSNPELMGRIVELRTKHGSFAECEKWLARLDIEGKDPLRPLLLRAKILAAQSKPVEAAALVEPNAEQFFQSAKDEQTKIEIAKSVGGFYSEIGLSNRAEPWYRLLSALDGKQASLVIMSLTQQKRAGDALAFCVEQGTSDTTSRAAVLATAVMAELLPPPEVCEVAEPLIQNALKKHSEDIGLLYGVGTLYIAQGRYEDAVATFRKLLALKPGHVPTLNNLAMILAESPNKRAEALQLIDQAIDLVGPDPGLLDTKGAILVYDGKSEQALPLLEVAARGAKVDPRHNLHLAAAYCNTTKTKLAHDRLKLALDGELENLILTRTDQVLLAELRSQLGL